MKKHTLIFAIALIFANPLSALAERDRNGDRDEFPENRKPGFVANRGSGRGTQETENSAPDLRHEGDPDDLAQIDRLTAKLLHQI